MALMETPENIVKSFFESLRTESTRKNYSYGITRVLGGEGKASEFLSLADRNKWHAQEYLMHWIQQNREIGEYAVLNYLRGVRALAEYAEIDLKWKKVFAACPALPKPKDDSPPIEAIRKIYALGDLRMKFLIHVFISSPRVGAFEYFTFRDLREIEVGGFKIGMLTVYRGQAEEYITFITPEGMAIFRQYIDYRKRSGEELNDSSPLIRSAFNPFPGQGEHSSVKILKPKSVQMLFRDAWIRAGYPATDRNFKLVHCFRKFLKTRLEDTEMKSNFIEMLQGHSLRLQGHYQKTKMLDLAKQFVTYMSSLYITEEPLLLEELKAKEEELKNSKNEWYIGMKRLEDEMNRIKLLSRLNRQLDKETDPSKQHDLSLKIEELSGDSNQFI